MKEILRRAMIDSETFVVELEYADAKGNRTRRVVSPIRFVGNDRVLALCLCREEPRQFYLSRCSNLRLIPAAEVIMPVPMQPVEAVAAVAASSASTGMQACLA
ncbi:WYL domain-containing protein [Roseiconus lacunae]|uniref:WYL domain-containing protein n=1 Tax=Roseiconus lacunae TaxID=2605694 RepID=A0ABT7PKY5_9BACT|nr:hypothetical protein [Roseiconus lacunae]MCD0460798.1 hypothetical protein [Roseiconus lacunae]MDM4017151.1 hypothetical protein [Roseiconus lacunae]WRQ51271.1 hypothetical protein U8335_01740 [Stieleria sp. HD01]